MKNSKPSRKAAWLVPTAQDNSGGYRTIFEHAKALENAGWEVVLYVREGSSNKATQKIIEKHFSLQFNNVVVGWNDIQPCEVVFATIWYSAPIVNSLEFKCRKLYFIQDFEPTFMPVGSHYIAAKNSYELSLEPITLGRNISIQLKNHWNTKSNFIDFGADLSIYKNIDSRREKAVCFTYQPKKQRRCSVLGTTALHIVKTLRPDITIYLYGSNEKSKLPFAHENLGFLSVQECNKLYNKCSIGLCLSASNPSRIPFEMMASGMAVIDLWGENTSYDFPDDCMLLSKDTPLSIAMAIINLVDDNEKRMALQKNAVKFMLTRDIKNETNTLINILDDENQSNNDINAHNKLYTKEAFECLKTPNPEVQEIIVNYCLPKTSIKHKIPPALHPFCQRIKNIFHAS